MFVWPSQLSVKEQLVYVLLKYFNQEQDRYHIERANENREAINDTVTYDCFSMA